MGEPLRLSVHGLVDLLLREGDIDNRIYNADTMEVGSILHRLHQSSQKGEYIGEVSLSRLFHVNGKDVLLEGRADGVILGRGIPVLEEIKTSVIAPERFHDEQREWHLGQARCYALMYLLAHGGEEIRIRLTYINQKDFKDVFVEELVEDRESLEKEVLSLIEEYLSLLEGEFAHLEEKDRSLEGLPFPYESYRAGQRDMMRYVYGAIRKGLPLFLEAPTGIGKTISALFPALQAMRGSRKGKIFYLTAKTSGANSARDALALLYAKGLRARDAHLVAKERICPNPSASCNPVECPLAKGYYGKMRKALRDASRELGHFGTGRIRSIAKELSTCPFELSLDLSLLADVIVADYNYVFDPFARLERYFGGEAEKGVHVALVDEAHNLIERGRECYGAEITSGDLEEARRSLRGKKDKRLLTISRSLGALKKEVLSFLPEEGADPVRMAGVPPAILKRLDKTEEKRSALLREEFPPHLPFACKEFSREIHRFRKINEEYAEETIPYLEALGEKGWRLRLFCPDASPMLQESVRSLRSAIFFSGTLSPSDYYMEALAGSREVPGASLPSPFPQENLRLILAPGISTRYRDRDRTLPEVAGYLSSFVKARPGNYLLFLPSFLYLEKVLPLLSIDREDLIVQRKEMDEEAKEEFLLSFRPDGGKRKVGLAVIGGSLAEGIDLSGDRLIGVAIVGVGLPTPSYERELLRDHFERKLGQGFAYAYRNPGLNKVMQALGRLIRSERDVGAALLIDDRYLKGPYFPLLQRKDPALSFAYSKEDAQRIAASFFEGKEREGRL